MNETLYWVSFLVQDEQSGNVWLNSITSGCTSYSQAMNLIKRGKSQFNVLSAWIDTFENDNKNTVYHECCIK